MHTTARKQREEKHREDPNKLPAEPSINVPVIGVDMQTAKVTEIARLSPHRRQVALVRASLLSGVAYSKGPSAQKR
jgi:hypothetical protein